MDTTGIIIIILIVCAGGFVFYQIVRAVANKIEQNEASGKSYFLWRILLIFLCFLMLLPRIHRAQTRKHHYKTNQTPQQTLKTTDNSTVESSDGRLYFMSSPSGFLPDEEGTLYLAECALVEASQTSCNIQCRTLTITYNMKYSGLKEQIQCDQGVKQINYSNGIEFSNIYYIEPEATCVKHTTKYDNEQLSQKNCPDISCRLLKQYVINNGHFPFSCNAGFESFITNPINKQDFLELRTPKLRNYEEFERLYK